MRTTPPKRGWDSVSVPGAVAAWVTMSERFGKLPFADLLAPAIDIAERGYMRAGGACSRNGAAAQVAELASPARVSRRPSCRAGRAPQVGELFQHARRPRTACAPSPRRKGEALYGGEIAEALARLRRRAGRRR